MLKILTIISLLSLQQIAYSLDAEYNPDLFKMSKESNVGKIIHNLPISLQKLHESLGFLSPIINTTSPLKVHSAQSFETLLMKSKNLIPQTLTLENFVKNCEIIYNLPDQNLLIKEAVYRLLNGVITDLYEHYKDLEEIQGILRNSNPSTNLNPYDAPTIVNKSTESFQHNYNNRSFPIDSFKKNAEDTETVH